MTIEAFPSNFNKAMGKGKHLSKTPYEIDSLEIVSKSLVP